MPDAIPSIATTPGETLFRTLVEHSANVITVLSADGHIAYQNPAARRVLGGDRNPTPDGTRFPMDRFVHREDLPALQARIFTSIDGATVTLTPYRVRHADGRWRWLEGTATNLTHAPGVRGHLISARDVTARVHAEARTRAYEAVTAALGAAQDTPQVVQMILLQVIPAMDAIAGGVIRLDETAGHLEVLGSVGYPEVTERPWRSFPLDAPVPAADAVRDGRDRFFTVEDWTTQYPHMQHARLPASGSNAVLVLEAEGQVLGALTLTFAEDRAFSETERQFLRTLAAQCAQALRRGELHSHLERRERHFRKLSEYSHDAITLLSADGVVRYASPSVQGMLGFTPQDLLGTRAFDGIHPDDQVGVRQHFERCLHAPSAQTLVTYRHRTRDGRWVWLESTGTNALHDPDVGGFIVNTRDVSGRHEAQLAQQVTERRMQLLEEQSASLIRIFNPAGQCLYASPAATTMLGFTPEELRAFPALTLVHPDDQARLRDVWTHGQALAAYRMRRRDGTYIWVESASRRVTDAAGALLEVHVSMQDVTRRRQAEEAVQAQLRRYQQLVELTAEFTLADSPETLTQKALERALALTEYQYGYYFPAEGDAPNAPLYVGERAREMFQWTTPLAALHHSGVVGRALRRHAPFYAGPDTPLFDPPEPLPRAVWTSAAVLPIIVRGTLRGVLAFGTHAPITASDETRTLLQGICEQVARAIERNLHLEELRVSREETLRALGLALEYRDYETKGHTDRVVTLTERLGRALGIAGADLDALRWGAFLHDTGKVAIPDAVLLKPGRLDPDEWAIIRRHPDIGYEMLSHIPSLPPGTLEVVLYHQERWDGSGYPKGLAGTQIPLAARVFAVVDVYDALTSERPYKRAWTHDEAAAQLRREAGVLLDARVVRTFLQLFATPDRDDPEAPQG